MAKSRSFKEYVANRFENQLFVAVADYLEQGNRDLDVLSGRVQRIDRAELSGIEVMGVYIEDRPGMNIAFAVLLEAQYEIWETDRHNDRSAEKIQWFRISCTGDLSRNLDNFSIIATNVDSGRGRQHNPMSHALVPIINREQMEAVAKDFLERYYPEALDQPMAIDPVILAERLGLRIRQKCLTSDCSSFGQVVFRDCALAYYDSDDQEFKTEQVKKGTIVVDPEVYFLRNLGSLNNTIVHECVHWDKHRKAFELERLYNGQASQIQCQVIGGMKGNEAWAATDWMEWQANTLAPRILMPLIPAKIKCAELIRANLKAVPGSEPIDILEAVIEETARFFGVSRLAAKIRMVEIGFEEAIGAFTYIDGRYVKPHSFKAGALKRNQTFSISERDAIFESAMNLSLREQIERGSYLFVDSHFCIHDAQYIAYDERGQPLLTDYARHHMDECCLVFELKLQKNASRYGREYFTDCVLFRDATDDIIFEAHFIASAINDDVDAQARAIAAYTKELAHVLQNLPGSFSGALKALMAWKEKTVDNLAEASGLEAKTIQRMRNDEEYQSTIESIVSICIALQLPDKVSDALISRSSCSLGVSEKHLMYGFLLKSYYTKGIHECNALLQRQDFPPLTKMK